MSLLPLQPFAAKEQLPVPYETHETITSAIISFYRFLTTMPHIDASSLHFAPEAGWTDVDEEGLRARGRSDEAIRFVKHLPCFHQPGVPYFKGGNVELVPGCLSIAYHTGRIWDGFKHERFPTPGNVIWLAQMEAWDDVALLVDIDAGTITQLSADPGGPPLMSFEARKSLKPEDRWMSHPTWSVSTYFREARKHYERLIFIPYPISSRRPDEWKILARSGNEIWDDIVSDEDADYDSDDDMVESAEETDSECDPVVSEVDLEDAEEVIGEDEIVALLEEAQPDGTVASGVNTGRVLTRPVRAFEEEKKGEKQSRFEQRCIELIAVYRRNGWPSESYDRDRCAHELKEWTKFDDERNASATRAKLESMRQRERNDAHA